MDTFSRLWGEPTIRHVARKIPMRVEPKSFYSNERTFLSWLKMAVALGGVSSAIYVHQEAHGDENEGTVSNATVRLIYLSMMPVSIIMIAYASFVTMKRRHCLKTKTVTYFFNDRYGPTCIAMVIVAVLVAILVSSLKDVIDRA